MQRILFPEQRVTWLVLCFGKLPPAPVWRNFYENVGGGRAITGD